MVQERLYWNYGFHAGQQLRCMEHVCKIERSFQDHAHNVTWRMYFAEHMLNWKDPMDQNESPMVFPVVIGNHIARPVLKTEPAHI